MRVILRGGLVSGFSPPLGRGCGGPGPAFSASRWHAVKALRNHKFDVVFCDGISETVVNRILWG